MNARVKTTKMTRMRIVSAWSPTGAFGGASIIAAVGPMKSTVARSSPNPVLYPTLTPRDEEPIERLDRLAGGVHHPRDGQLPVLDHPVADQLREERSPPGAQKYHGAPPQAPRAVK